MRLAAASVAGGFAGHRFAESLLPAAGALLLVLVLTYLAGRIAGKHSVIDTAWGLLYCAAAIVAFLASSGHGDAGRRWLLLAMTLLWGLRLAAHIGRRSIGKGEDPRYEQMLRDRGPLQTIGLVYGLQGLLAYLIAMPILVGCFEPGGLGVLALIGVLLWVVGVLFEGVGDWQLERYKADKAAGKDVGQVMDGGLWRYTRHPNYFGDACVWVGIFAVSAEHWPGLLTVFSPVIMVYLLAFGSGKRVLERSMAQRPGYRDYMARTSGFVPLPPGHSPSSRR
jgi:steroid 5-alpha reductase family enzyme